jgi:hypothetical protein
VKTKIATSMAVLALAAAAPAASQTIEEQLRELKQLRDAGLISDPVYGEKQRRILESGVPQVSPQRAVEPKIAITPVATGDPLSKMPPVGASWSYRLQDKLYPRRQHAFLVKVDAVNGAKITELVRDRKGEQTVLPVDAQSVRFVKRHVGGDVRFVELSPYLVNAASASGLPNAPTNYPLGGSGEPFRIRVTSIVEDHISVPAGSFKTIRVDVTGERSASGAQRSGRRGLNSLAVTRFKYTAWYSADVNRYVMLRHQQWNPSEVRSRTK